MIKLEDSIVKNLASNNSQDELVKTYELYGVFLENNSFVVGKLESIFNGDCQAHYLYDFFIKDIIYFFATSIEDEQSFPWKVGIISTEHGIEAIACPFSRLTTKHILNDKTSKQIIATVLDTVNKYIKENPTFVDNMFKSIEVVDKNKR